ncbi:type VII secretion-associated serine protease mycosin [Catenuloplanes atrovinosus]|uniref:Type VII secretion-associated serine protease mycosin n=1 Tax=Catenuloplanes atrovinosus TaxID=137266 RepID=A0AAE3YX78_9ACTN|nr:type VII secretion-associated serine protease mycosin [Catenuloplanes atrovinosus]MDR7280276.1 type VII secretion-associated serine protease mycosin [Catenuloplanes atrovinosus]
MARLAAAVLVGATATLPFGPPSASAGPAASFGGSFAAVPLPVTGDEVRDEQWSLTELGMAEAWQRSTGAGVTVAVIDSGVDDTHADLAGRVRSGFDLVTTGGDGTTDPVGHGTTVAALIAGVPDQSGIIGMAPDAQILPIRVLDKQNRYDDAQVVAKAVRLAVDNGAKVINLSLGGLGSSPALATAIDYAFVKDVVVIACTGNSTASAPSEVWYPAREPGVIAVTGLEENGTSLWSGSITGPETVLSAPATDLIGARPGGYWRVQGTSFAAPMVAATAALIRARWPQMSAASVVNRLIGTATDLGAPGRDDRYGFGMVNPVAALADGLPEASYNVLDNEQPPGDVGFGFAPGAGRDSRAESGDASKAPGNGVEGRPGGAAQPAPAEAAPTAPRGRGLLGVLIGGSAVLIVIAILYFVTLHRLPRLRPSGRRGP